MLLENSTVVRSRLEWKTQWIMDHEMEATIKGMPFRNWKIVRGFSWDSRCSPQVKSHMSTVVGEHQHFVMDLPGQMSASSQNHRS